jgi:hypothetical protein
VNVRISRNLDTNVMINKTIIKEENKIIYLGDDINSERKINEETTRKEQL